MSLAEDPAVLRVFVQVFGWNRLLPDPEYHPLRSLVWKHSRSEMIKAASAYQRVRMIRLQEWLEERTQGGA